MDAWSIVFFVLFITVLGTYTRSSSNYAVFWQFIDELERILRLHYIVLLHLCILRLERLCS